MRTRLSQIMLLFLMISLVVVPVGAQDSSPPLVLRIAWWGSDARHQKYEEMLNLYESQFPNVKLEREFSGWAPYWDRLAVQAAGGRMPDIPHMHTEFFSDYASRGTLLDLTPYIESGRIDLSNFPESTINIGRYGDGIYMIALGSTSEAMFYNPAMIEAAGFAPPTGEQTWSEFADYVIALSEALPEGTWALEDNALRWIPYFEIFLRQRGKALFVDAREIGFDEQDLTDWFAYWKRLLDAGAIPPPQVTQELTGDIADSLLVKGLIAMRFNSANQLPLYQRYIEDDLLVTKLPRGESPDSPAGDIVFGAYLSIAASSPNADAAAHVINWILNDEQAAVIYSAEHGPPGSVVIQEMLRPNLSVPVQRLFDFQESVLDGARPPAARPDYGGEMANLYIRAGEMIKFGSSVEDAVQFFFNELDFITN